MKGKPFISCPLEAALAAKNHGFKFVHDGGAECDILALISGGILLKYWNIRLYIAPESLPLLEPVVGDIAEIPNSINTVIIIHSAEECNDFRIDGVIPDYAYETPEDAVKYGYTKIIQRQGKVFPTIQFEDVE